MLNKDEAHLGLVAYPQKDDGAKCQQCHLQDSQARLEKFASLGGYKPVNEAVPFTPASAATAGFPELSESKPIAENLPWVASAIVFFGLWLALVLFSPQKP